MILPWPITDSDAVLYEALDIAMGYLERTGWADEDHEVIQAMAASVILHHMVEECVTGYVSPMMRSLPYRPFHFLLTSESYGPSIRVCCLS
jgi:hypothetical protein